MCSSALLAKQVMGLPSKMKLGANQVRGANYSLTLTTESKESVFLAMSEQTSNRTESSVKAQFIDHKRRVYPRVDILVSVSPCPIVHVHHLN